MEVSCHFAVHFMQRAAVHILVYATCCSKIKRDAGSQAVVQPEDPGSGGSAEEAFESARSGSDGTGD